MGLQSPGGTETFRESGTPGVFTVGMGSASVIHPAGYLLTIDHVVSGAANGRVHLSGKAPLPFRIIAGMSSEDLALIKIAPAEPLETVSLGRSDDLLLGEPVLVIGSPGGLAHSVSKSICTRGRPK